MFHLFPSAIVIEHECVLLDLAIAGGKRYLIPRISEGIDLVDFDYWIFGDDTLYRVCRMAWQLRVPGHFINSLLQIGTWNTHNANEVTDQ